MGKNKKRTFKTDWVDSAQGGTGSGFLFGERGYFQAHDDFKTQYGMSPRQYKKTHGGLPSEGFLYDDIGIDSGGADPYNIGSIDQANSMLGTGKGNSLNEGLDFSSGIYNDLGSDENKIHAGNTVRSAEDIVGEYKDKLSGKDSGGGDGMGMSSAQMGAMGDMAGGIGSIVSGIVGGGKRRAEQAAAESEYDTFKNRFDNLSTANVYKNLNNPYEDLTVNLKQANFQAQQQQQGLSNTMRSLQGAAGGSGIAALAQAMSNQQGQNLQQISANIGQQESANQKLKAQGAMQAQMAERQGELISNQMEAQKTATQLGRADERLREANLAREQATKALVGGVAQLGMGVASGGAAGMFGDPWFDGSRQ